MAVRIKNFLLNELAFLLLAPTLVMIGIVLYGILFDSWYKDAYNILLASGALYLVILLIRLITWITRKIRN